jgi:hypothetical protein
MNNALRTYAKDNGGRVSLLLLLFLLAIYEFISAGFPAFAVICMIPVIVLFVIGSFRYRMLLFWILIIYNYFIQMQDAPKLPVPTSLPNEMLQLALIAIAIIDVEKSNFERIGNIMFFSLLAWGAYCTIEVLNDSCGLGINIGAWYQGARMMAFQLLYIFLVFTLFISNPKILTQYLYVWGALALFAVFWVWKQKYIGFSSNEFAWLYYGSGRTTHLIQGGTLIRYWSIYSDAANYGVGIASTGVAFVIFGITSKIKKLKYFFIIVGGACIWGMFPSGTRTATVCLMAGFIAYIFLSKSFKIAIPFTLVFGFFAFILAFTNIGQGNQQIRRMRSAFKKDDASANVRTMNQQVMKKYMKDAPWGIGLGMNPSNVPANNKYNKMAAIPPDSEYVFIWLRTGVVGITVFLICAALMLFGACWIVFFTLKSPSLRGIGAGFTCAFIAIQLGGYGNQVLMQFPNCLVFYGGLTIVYVLPWIEKEWIEWESKELAIQEEKKRLKLEKKLASRV